VLWRPVTAVRPVFPAGRRPNGRMPTCGRPVPVGRSVLLVLLGLGLLGLLARLQHLTATLLGGLAALLTGRQELAGLGVTGPLLGDVVHPLAELLGVTLVLGALVGAAPLLARPARLVARRLLGGRDVALLLLGLLTHLTWLLAHAALLGQLAAHPALLLLGLLLELLGGLLAHLPLLLATVALGLVAAPVDGVLQPDGREGEVLLVGLLDLLGVLLGELPDLRRLPVGDELAGRRVAGILPLLTALLLSALLLVLTLIRVLVTHVWSIAVTARWQPILTPRPRTGGRWIKGENRSGEMQSSTSSAAR